MLAYQPGSTHLPETIAARATVALMTQITVSHNLRLTGPFQRVSFGGSVFPITKSVNLSRYPFVIPSRQVHI